MENAFGATRHDLLITTSQHAAMEEDKMIAADSLQHGSMTLLARNGPVTVMGSGGAQMGFTLVPREFNDCYNPRMQQASAFSHSLLHQLLAGNQSVRTLAETCELELRDFHGLHQQDSAFCSFTVGRGGRVQDGQSTLILEIVTQ